MKITKHFFLIFCVFLVVTASLFPCSASLADEGYLWDSEGGFWYLPKSESADEESTTQRGPFRVRAASETGTTTAFSGFDKNKIDVAGFPDYVQKTISSSTSFTWLIVTSDKFYLWVADGCVPTVSSTNGNLFIINTYSSSPNYSGYFTTEGFTPSCYNCFYAVYSWNTSDDLYSSISSPWTTASTKNLTRSGEGEYYFTYNIPSSLSKVDSDFYAFGSVAFRSKSVDSISFPMKNGDNLWCAPGSWSDVVSKYNSKIGSFSSSTSKFRLIDGGSFPTATSQQAETQRGILGLLKALPDKIKAFFTSLADRISGFFTTLKNYILYLNAEGSSSYSNPFSGLLSSFESKISSYINKLVDFNSSLDSTLQGVVDYVENGSDVIDLFLNGVPLLSALLLFFVVFSVVRKVVGR